MEKEIIQTCSRPDDGQRYEPILSHFVVSQVAERQPNLNRAQQTAIEQVLTSSDRIQAIQGYAGVGKSTGPSAAYQPEGAQSTPATPWKRFAPTLHAAGRSSVIRWTLVYPRLRRCRVSLQRGEVKQQVTGSRDPRRETLLYAR